MDKQMEAKRMDLGGSFTLCGTSITLNRTGYGAMQLAGPQVWGPPRDVNAAIAVLREAVAAGGKHIHTHHLFGPPRKKKKKKTGAPPLPRWGGAFFQNGAPPRAGKNFGP